jgi:hypothetical protein
MKQHLVPGLLLAVFVLLLAPASAQDVSFASVPLASRLGITFISSADLPTNEERYYQAKMLGAGWNRWPLYWNEVEQAAGIYDWSDYDRLVMDDLRHGLQINAILLGSPEFHRAGDSIEGLDLPIFSDGTDILGEGKTPNSQNLWARFVFDAVTRYKPNGILAQTMGLPAGQGITVWEAWNEPDFKMFWSGSVENYARLLKVTYLAAHLADPNAEVMFAGLGYSNPEADDWLAKVLAIYAQDSQSSQNNWFMDKVAVHNYSYSWRSGWVVRWVKRVLSAYGLTRPVWLNETGVPVWDDYPGPTWAKTPEERTLRATMQQQAAFVIQSAAYAWAEGAEVVLFHQLYDDCGNQAMGTDFPPNDGSLCSGGACWGDAHGLFRNEPSAVCFRQHPQGGTPRPAAASFRLLGQIFGGQNFGSGAVQTLDGIGVVVTFEREATGERLYVVWNQSLERATLEVPAGGVSATMYDVSGQDWIIAPDEGVYQISLPPATRDDYPYLQQGEPAGIGGIPYILVEQVDEAQRDLPLNPALVRLEAMSTPRSPLETTPGAIVSVIQPEPTAALSSDTIPPATSMMPLPLVSPATFTVSWSGQDNSGIDRYLVWVRIQGGDWQPWLETEATSAEYTGEVGKTYEFAVWAVDLAGNWSLNTELATQAVTTVR